MVRYRLFRDGRAGSGSAFRAFALWALAATCVGPGVSLLVVEVAGEDDLFQQVLLPALDGILVSRGDLVVVRAQIILVKVGALAREDRL